MSSVACQETVSMIHDIEPSLIACFIDISLNIW